MWGQSLPQPTGGLQHRSRFITSLGGRLPLVGGETVRGEEEERGGGRGEREEDEREGGGKMRGEGEGR